MSKGENKVLVLTPPNCTKLRHQSQMESHQSDRRYQLTSFRVESHVLSTQPLLYVTAKRCTLAGSNATMNSKSTMSEVGRVISSALA